MTRRITVLASAAVTVIGFTSGALLLEASADDQKTRRASERSPEIRRSALW